MKRYLLVFLALTLLISGCSKPSETNGGKEVIHVTTTTGQIKDAVMNVGGEHVKVEALMGPGVDPHLYQASQGDIRKLTEADIIFYNGLHLEGKMGEIFEKMTASKPTVPVGESIPESHLIKTEGSTYHDPHIWFDIDNWVLVVKAIEQELTKLSPEHEDQFKKNADSYIAELEELKQYAATQIQSIPEQQRILVTAHDAFAYFGNAYSLEVRGLQGLSTDAEYGLKDVQDLVHLLVEKKIKSVFIETSISERSIQAIIEGARTKGHTVTVGGELFSDAMGEEGSEEGTYIGMYKHNVDTIVGALK